MPRRGIATEAVTAYVTPEEASRIDAAAREDEQTRSKFMRRVLISEMVRRTRREQGLPETVADPVTLRRVADVFIDGARS